MGQDGGRRDLMLLAGETPAKSATPHRDRPRWGPWGAAAHYAHCGVETFDSVCLVELRGIEPLTS